MVDDHGFERLFDLVLMHKKLNWLDISKNYIDGKVRTVTRLSFIGKRLNYAGWDLNPGVLARINLLVSDLLIDWLGGLPGMTLAKGVRVDGKTSTAINTWQWNSLVV